MKYHFQDLLDLPGWYNPIKKLFCPLSFCAVPYFPTWDPCLSIGQTVNMLAQHTHCLVYAFDTGQCVIFDIFKLIRCKIFMLASDLVIVPFAHSFLMLHIKIMRPFFKPTLREHQRITQLNAVFKIDKKWIMRLDVQNIFRISPRQEEEAAQKGIIIWKIMEKNNSSVTLHCIMDPQKSINHCIWPVTIKSK